MPPMRVSTIREILPRQRQKACFAPQKPLLRLVDSSTNSLIKSNSCGSRLCFCSNTANSSGEEITDSEPKDLLNSLTKQRPLRCKKDSTVFPAASAAMMLLRGVKPAIASYQPFAWCEAKYISGATNSGVIPASCWYSAANSIQPRYKVGYCGLSCWYSFSCSASKSTPSNHRYGQCPFFLPHWVHNALIGQTGKKDVQHNLKVAISKSTAIKHPSRPLVRKSQAARNHSRHAVA